MLKMMPNKCLHLNLNRIAKTNMFDKKQPILIIGGGTFGLSTAYHLALAKYENVTVLEKGLKIPGSQSAANDINKIVRAEYIDPFYSDLALEAIGEWSSNPVFRPYYHETGYFLGVSGSAPDLSRYTLGRQLDSIQAHPAWAGKISAVKTRDDIKIFAPALDGEMPGWTGYFNTFAGYAQASAAMNSLYRELLNMGVNIKLGAEVDRLIYEENGDSDKVCVGAVTRDKVTYLADRVVLTLGGAIGQVVPAVGRQILAKAWALAHIQLTPQEAIRLKGIPVTFMRDLGFFFEPEPGTGLMKISAEGAGYSNFVDGVSVTASEEQSNFLPVAAEAKIRRLLQEALPSLADRPLIDGHVCWCADAADQNYVIDNVPGVQGLIVATGDSGHGFKMLPIAGKWIKAVVESGSQTLPRWCWKKNLDASVDDMHRSGHLENLHDAVRSKM